jgi:ATP-dependent DNA ligase
MIKSYATLYGKDKSNKTRVWTISVIKRSDNPFIHVEHGVKDGQLVVTDREVKTGKNLGKKNETSVEEQAILMADKMYKDKIEKDQYVTSESSFEEEKSQFPISPMLCDKYDPTSKSKRKVDIVFPCFSQPKLDGVRCLSYKLNGTWKNQSRELRYFKNLDHINKQLELLFGENPFVLDGELYIHNSIFNKFVGIIKKEKKPEGKDLEMLHKIQYHIYDCIFLDDRTADYEKRYTFLESILKNNDVLKLVKVRECKKEDVQPFHLQEVQNGYEGLILRNKNASYETTRTRNLQKYKEFDDNEFEIIGFKEGEGLDAGTVIWICKVDDKNTVDARPSGTHEERAEWFKNGKKYIGKMLTIKYQGFSDKGIPRFPVGKGIRDYE